MKKNRTNNTVRFKFVSRYFTVFIVLLATLYTIIIFFFNTYIENKTDRLILDRLNGLDWLNTFEQYKYDISKIERGVAPPPQSKEKLEEYAGYLCIVKDSDDWYSFFDYAAASTGRIPPDVMNDDELVKKLPLVFRTLRGQKPSIEQLNKLAEIVRRT